MSVTESKAKSTKKSTTTKPMKEAAEALKTALEVAQIEFVPLSMLVKSPFNVRTIPYSIESVIELADSINAVGLLQNLVVHTLQNGTLGVAAGGRRLTAMIHLADRGTFSPEHPVAVKRVPDELAVVASMTENGKRWDMHPAEQIVGFRTLAAEGKTPAQIGDLLGYGARHVQRMLKLSELAPAILNALASDELTTEHCHALALESDQKRQVQVLDAARQNGYGNIPRVNDIRSMITQSEVSTESAKFQFVGEAAFKDGEIRRDLFSEDNGGYVDAVLLDTRLMEKLGQVAEEIKVKEGWSWCLHRMESLSWHGEDGKNFNIKPEPDAVYTEDENLRLIELNEQYDASPGVCDESVAMEAEMEAIEQAACHRAWTTEQRDSAGVFVSWSYNELKIQRGIVQKTVSEEGDAEVNEPNIRIHQTREHAPEDEISLPLITKMSSERTLAVQAALMQQPTKAVALLVWTLCQSVFSTGYYDNPSQIRLECSHYSLSDNAPSGQQGSAYLALMDEKARLKSLLPTGWAKDFTTFFTLPGELMMHLMAFCTACSLNGVQTREHGFTSRSRLDVIETALDFHMRDWWQPTKIEFFGNLTKSQIVDALNDAGLTGAARDADKMKKTDAAEFAESKMADTRWVPVWMQAPVKVVEESDITETENTANAA